MLVVLCYLASPSVLFRTNVVHGKFIRKASDKLRCELSLTFMLKIMTRVKKVMRFGSSDAINKCELSSEETHSERN